LPTTTRSGKLPRATSSRYPVIFMTADFDPAKLDSYVVAQFAYWAGDYKFAYERFTEASRGSPESRGERGRVDDSTIESLAESDALLTYIADRRKGRMDTKIKALAKLMKAREEEVGEHDLLKPP